MRTVCFVSALVGMLLGCGAQSHSRSLAHIDGNHIVIDRNIHFDNDSAVLSSVSSDVIHDVASILHVTPAVRVVHVVGHTDETGDSQHNQELSHGRAEAVAHALRADGVTQTIDARGVGETEQLCSEDTDACNGRNRRVEFLLEYR